MSEDYIRSLPLRNHGFQRYGITPNALWISPYTSSVVSLEEGLRQVAEHEGEQPPTAATVTLNEGKP
jgi:hypothetical protein